MKKTSTKIYQVVITAVMVLVSMTNGFAQCTGDQVTYGTNNQWIGYVYQGTNFDTYRGYVNEGTVSNPNFDQNFGGSASTYNTTDCDIFTNLFSVRYKLTKTFTSGYYDLAVGGDDGYRLSVDGGATWVINRWIDQSYAQTTTTVFLNGTVNLVLEFYENGGDNRVTFSVGPGCVPSGNQSVYGTGNEWRGYLFQGNNFDTYRGSVIEGTSTNPNFDQSFGGSNTTYSTTSCGIQTENFSARYRLTKNFTPATYVFVVGGDDGYRLSLDGGLTWVIDNWNPHSYTTSTYSTFLSGTRNMVLEFFENGGDNRVSFAMTSNGTLPVKLTSFTAKATAADKVQLSWKVSEEMNFSHYVIQRSTGGNAFTDIAIEAGQEEDVHIETAYKYTDHLNYSGMVHYRLKMVDKDGSAEYSSVATVSLNVKEGSIKIYPTVVEDGKLYVETTEKMEQGKVEIIDMQGRTLLSNKNINVGRNQVWLGSVHMSTGSYLVRVTDGNKLVVAKKFIVK